MIEPILESLNMSNQRSYLCAAAPLLNPALTGRSRGVVCIFFTTRYLQTPPRPSDTPPHDGRGAAAPPVAAVCRLFKVDSKLA